ncbi:MAG: Gfo/Idh/MocA family oxidoreductase [Phycisphaerales bacterium]|nr:Gfo/Idh/MocA family oxidoreductase [Phycisphaerales bacterium]
MSESREHPASTPHTNADESRDFAPTISRRAMLALGAAGLTGLSGLPGMGLGSSAFAAPAIRTRRRADEIRIGVIGCGGRGTGAAFNALEADPDTRIVALADLFRDRLDSCRGYLASSEDFAERATVPDAACFTGFDAYRQLLAGVECDYVILATPPGFRPTHFDAAVRAGRNVFMEKPVAVDPAGIRTVLAASDEADRRDLCVVTGTQRRHEVSYLEAIGRAMDGEIGEFLDARCYWNQGGLWVVEKKPEFSDVEWQCRNWLYFTWLSGDHIVEQHVHNLDVINWAFGGPPRRASGMGGRQVRTAPEYGHVFDHFAIEYEYPDGQRLLSMCRQIDGCDGRVEEVIRGTHGTLTTRPGYASIEPAAGGAATEWRFTGANPNPYAREHADLIRAMRSGPRINEARVTAESTLTAIMGRMAAYTGKAVTWDQAMNSALDIVPHELAFGPMSVPPVAVPGRTPLV